jgi:hypothetical protein
MVETPLKVLACSHHGSASISAFAAPKSFAGAAAAACVEVVIMDEVVQKPNEICYCRFLTDDAREKGKQGTHATRNLNGTRACFAIVWQLSSATLLETTP